MEIFLHLLIKKIFFILQNAFVYYAIAKSKTIPEEIKKQALEKFKWADTLEVVDNYFENLFIYVESKKY